MMSLLKSKRNIFLLFGFFAAALLAGACSPSAEKLVKDGNEAFYKQAFEEAQAAYLDAEIESPELAEPYYNAANALYRQGAYPEAIEELTKALQFADQETLAEHSHFNLGNAAFSSQDLESAIASYIEALLLNPADEDAKYNLELALRQQESQEDQQNQKNQDQPEEQQGQENQEDQQNQNQSGDQASQQNQQSQDQSEEQQEGQGQPQNGENQEQQDGQPGQIPASGQRMTEEQARQLLAAIAQDSETLAEKLGEIMFFRSLPPVQDW